MYLLEISYARIIHVFDTLKTTHSLNGIFNQSINQSICISGFYRDIVDRLYG